MKYAKWILLGVAFIFVMTAAAPLASAQAAHVRWDIATVVCTGPNGSFPCTLNPGGSATAMALDCAVTSAGFGNFGCSTITMTGSGTFLAPDNGGSSSGVTGGGTWKVVSADGTITTGTFLVTELVQWQKSEPLSVSACGSCETTDNIGALSEATGGLAVLRVAYSDGTTGVVTLACNGLSDPFAITEGLIASKQVRLNNTAIPGFNVPPLPPNFPITKVLLPVLFWNPGIFQSTAEFHVN